MGAVGMLSGVSDLTIAEYCKIYACCRDVVGLKAMFLFGLILVMYKRFCQPQ